MQDAAGGGGWSGKDEVAPALCLVFVWATDCSQQQAQPLLQQHGQARRMLQSHLGRGQ
jgi:hypothetical protein